MKPFDDSSDDKLLAQVLQGSCEGIEFSGFLNRLQCDPQYREEFSEWVKSLRNPWDDLDFESNK